MNNKDLTAEEYLKELMYEFEQKYTDIESAYFLFKLNVLLLKIRTEKNNRGI